MRAFESVSDCRRRRSAMPSLTSALERILSDVSPLSSELVSSSSSSGRTLSSDVFSRSPHPRFDVSAMDGIAVRGSDLRRLFRRFRCVGTSPAGRPFGGRVGSGEFVRIFTGGLMPKGADVVLPQERVRFGDEERLAELDDVEIGESYVRRRGLDFSFGESLARRGDVVTPRLVGVFGCANVGRVRVHRRPRIVVMSCGDELRPSGSRLRRGEISAGNGAAICAFLSASGCDVFDAGIVGDDLSAMRESFSVAESAIGGSADVLVTIGGASSGDKDFAAEFFRLEGFRFLVRGVDMRPGKPMMIARRRRTHAAGLPGNPVSAMTCAELFLGPMVRRLSGRRDSLPPTIRCALRRPLPPNRGREHFMRAVLRRDRRGRIVTLGGLPMLDPFDDSDSSRVKLLASADCLAPRRRGAAAARRGDEILAIPLLTS